MYLNYFVWLHLERNDYSTWYWSEPVGTGWFRPVPTRFQLIPSGSSRNPTGSGRNPVRTAWNLVGTSWNRPVLIGTCGAQQSTDGRNRFFFSWRCWRIKVSRESTPIAHLYMARSVVVKPSLMTPLKSCCPFQCDLARGGTIAAWIIGHPKAAKLAAICSEVQWGRGGGC